MRSTRKWVFWDFSFLILSCDISCVFCLSFFSLGQRRDGTGRSSRRVRHDFAFLNHLNVATTGVGVRALRGFFNEYDVGEVAYIVVIPFGI